MKRFLTVLLIVAMVFCLVACGGSQGGNSSNAGSNDASDAGSGSDASAGDGSSSDDGDSAGGTVEGAGDLGDSYVEIKDAVLAKTYDGEDAIVITYAWTNNSDDTTSAELCLSESAFQDGVEMETAYVMESDDYDLDSGMKEVRPGTTIDVQCAFILTSDSVVEFELEEFFSFTDDKVTKDFDPAGL